ncbi:MAG: TonB-dependent receptor plug domain-containing protein [Limisphaerales bacterium]
MLAANAPVRGDETNDVAAAKSDLFDKPLQELMQYITIAKRTPEPLEKTAAAVSVLTQDDIRRSGATSIPEALRLVPGLDVARVDAHTWAISSRGFNDVFANKLLVMIDGRTVYSPLFSGVFWDEEDTMMEDIDRIEVVRGPGATLWGANAVNGVINVVTKSAKDSQGLLVTGGGGSEELGFGSVRYGFKLDDGIYMKVYQKYFDRGSSVFENGSDAFDAWSMYRGGFRIDVDKADNNLFTFQGDAYTGQENEVYLVPTAIPPAFVGSAKSIDNVAGVNVLGRWSHDFSKDSQFILQSYYDHTVRNNPVLSQTRNTGDVDFQHVFKVGERNEITWGTGFRTTHRDVKNSLNVALIPPNDTRNLYSAFLQDEITVMPDRLKMILGSKFEHNDFTGFEVQPSIRAVFTPHTNHTIWASVSRAVRTPSEAESDIRLNEPVVGVPPGAITTFGNPDMLSESLIAYEIGYRFQASRRLNFDLTAFYNDYSRLRSLQPLPPISPFFPAQIHPSVVGNSLTAESYGGEASVTLQAIPDLLTFKGGYSLLKLNAHRNNSGDQTTEMMDEGSSPQNQFFLLSSFDLPFHLEFDTTVRYVDRLTDPSVASYAELDARLAWHPRTNLEFAVVGQNLLHEHHREFAPTFIASQNTEVERGVYGKVTFRY